MPHFEQVTLGGGAIANAIALPSVARSAVLFTDTLLSRLDENEAWRSADTSWRISNITTGSGCDNRTPATCC